MFTRSNLFRAACLTVIATLTAPATYAQAKPAAPTSLPTKIGLIDMGHIFQNYARFKDAREQLKTQIQSVDADAKKMAEAIQAKAGAMKDLQEGSTAFRNAESELTRLAAEFEAFKQNQKRELVRAEAKLYKEIYLEVSKTVEQYADFYKYTLVLRYERAKTSKETSNPQEILKQLNTEVVYSKGTKDITDELLKFLNDRYKPAPQTATGTRTGTRN